MSDIPDEDLEDIDEFIAGIDTPAAVELRARLELADRQLEHPDEHFEMLWNGFGAADDSTLALDAIELKRKMRSIVGIDALQKQLADARAALNALTCEASGFVGQADPANHGHTNIAVLRHWINNAKGVLAALPQEPAKTPAQQAREDDEDDIQNLMDRDRG